ncbi:MAG TPA: enoyl-CoA hydratase-related protein, partial [bacterium]
MAYQFISVETRDHVSTITIKRPEVMNALHPPANFELGDAFNAFAKDDDAWVAIVTGAGDRAFSAGNDLKAT